MNSEALHFIERSVFSITPLDFDYKYITDFELYIATHIYCPLRFLRLYQLCWYSINGERALGHFC